MRSEFSAWNDAASLITAIWAARRSDKMERLPEILPLLHHADATVREEAASLIFLKWADHSNRALLTKMIAADPDDGVRARAAAILAMTTTSATRDDDIAALRAIVLDRDEDPLLRKVSYEGLTTIVRGKAEPLADDVDVDEDLDLEWVRRL